MSSFYRLSLLALLSLGVLSSCAVQSRKEAASPPSSVTQTTPNEKTKRAPAGFQNLTSTTAGPSILYRGPFLVGHDEPHRVAAKVYLPIQYDSKASWPLVVLLHGFTATGDLEDFYLGLSARVSLREFILLTPNGTRTPNGIKGTDGKDLSGIPFWNATDACCDFGQTKIDDAGYLQRVISEVKSQYHVDPKRIFIFGHSNGGFMANRMACEMGDQLAGVASLAGGTFSDSSKCKNQSPVAYLQIHAVDDPTIEYNEKKIYAGAKATVENWVTRNSCSDNPEPGSKMDNVLLIPGKDTTVQTWNRCESGRPVTFWTIKSYDQSKLHSPHVPLFNLQFTDRVLDFLFAQQRAEELFQ